MRENRLIWRNEVPKGPGNAGGEQISKLDAAKEEAQANLDAAKEQVKALRVDFCKKELNPAESLFEAHSDVIAGLERAINEAQTNADRLAVITRDIDTFIQFLGKERKLLTKRSTINYGPGDYTGDVTGNWSELKGFLDAYDALDLPYVYVGSTDKGNFSKAKVLKKDQAWHNDQMVGFSVLSSYKDSPNLQADDAMKSLINDPLIGDYLKLVAEQKLDGVRKLIEDNSDKFLKSGGLFDLSLKSLRALNAKRKFTGEGGVLLDQETDILSLKSGSATSAIARKKERSSSVDLLVDKDRVCKVTEVPDIVAPQLPSSTGFTMPVAPPKLKVEESIAIDPVKIDTDAAMNVEGLRANKRQAKVPAAMPMPEHAQRAEAEEPAPGFNREAEYQPAFDTAETIAMADQMKLLASFNNFQRRLLPKIVASFDDQIKGKFAYETNDKKPNTVDFKIGDKLISVEVVSSEQGPRYLVTTPDGETTDPLDGTMIGRALRNALFDNRPKEEKQGSENHLGSLGVPASANVVLDQAETMDTVHAKMTEMKDKISFDNNFKLMEETGELTDPFVAIYDKQLATLKVRVDIAESKYAGFTMKMDGEDFILTAFDKQTNQLHELMRGDFDSVNIQLMAKLKDIHRCKKDKDSAAYMERRENLRMSFDQHLDRFAKEQSLIVYSDENEENYFEVGGVQIVLREANIPRMLDGSFNFSAVADEIKKQRDKVQATVDPLLETIDRDLDSMMFRRKLVKIAKNFGLTLSKYDNSKKEMQLISPDKGKIGVLSGKIIDGKIQYTLMLDGQNYKLGEDVQSMRGNLTKLLEGRESTAGEKVAILEHSYNTSPMKDFIDKRIATLNEGAAKAQLSVRFEEGIVNVYRVGNDRPIAWLDYRAGKGGSGGYRTFFDGRVGFSSVAQFIDSLEPNSDK